MDGFLTQVSSSKRQHEPMAQGEAVPSKPRTQDGPKSAEDALDILKSEPDYDSLVKTLRFLRPGRPNDESFMLGTPSPQAARILQVLVTEIIPNYWQLLKDVAEEEGNMSMNRAENDVELLLRCVRSIAGVNAVLAHMRALIQASKAESAGAGLAESITNLKIMIEFLNTILEGSTTVYEIWTASSSKAKLETTRKPLSQELISLIGSGKAISLAAEAEVIVGGQSSLTEDDRCWVANSRGYSKWLARNLAFWMLKMPPPEDIKICADLLSKSLRLGHPDDVVSILVAELLVNSANRPSFTPSSFDALFKVLLSLEQKKFLSLILKCLADTYLTSSRIGHQPISAVAGLIAQVVGSDTKHHEHLASWVLSSAAVDYDDGLAIRRAVLAVISTDKDRVMGVLEKAIDQFGEPIYIKHTPVLQQEGLTQTLMLAAGHAYRASSLKMKRMMKSSIYLRAISNRLAASHNKARWLGMVVGEALSELTDVTTNKLSFKDDDLNSEEAMAYKNLVRCQDEIGDSNELRGLGDGHIQAPQQSTAQARARKTTSKPAARQPPMPAPAKTGFIIEEVSDDSDDNDIVPLAKPDSDPEDSDEDPTLITRNKPKAPVYVRQLIVYLRDTENYDHQKLGLTTAPSLIRRKANHGTEVKEHAEELASILVGLQDKFDLEDFHDLRHQAMIALLVAQPKIMGPWFGKTFFQGDYSISQRASVLTVLGLSARELAGFEESAYGPTTAFPSKTLPHKVARMYVNEADSSQRLPSSSLKALPSTALDSIARSVTSTYLAPMAADAADAVTGPDILKLSSFKEKASLASKTSNKPRLRAIPNTTAQTISTSYFFPLTSRFQHALHTPTVRARGVLFDSVLLSLFLKTAALLLHAAGPSTLALPDMTTELWGLLLGSSVQAHCAGDIAVTGAVLFGLLTLLEVNGDRMRDLCRDQSREVVQTQEWAMRVFENTRGEDGGQENDVKMLAAAVLIRVKEGMEKYQALLMGDMIG